MDPFTFGAVAVLGLGFINKQLETWVIPRKELKRVEKELSGKTNTVVMTVAQYAEVTEPEAEVRLVFTAKDSKDWAGAETPAQRAAIAATAADRSDREMKYLGDRS